MSKKECPSCDRDLTYPGAPGHECYTYEEHAKRIAANEGHSPERPKYCQRWLCVLLNGHEGKCLRRD